MTMDGRWRYWLLLAIALAFAIAVSVRGPIAQDPAYHALADGRALFGVPNFWNVASNAPFLLIGITGLWVLGARREATDLYAPYAVLFIGVILVAFGSAWYHLNPNNSTLRWDRLPMTMAFSAFTAIVIGQHISVSLGRRCLPFLVFIGISSVLYWHMTEMRGQGDLRPYALIQFLPLILIPFVIVLFPARFSRPSFIWMVLGSYAVAKLLELFDTPIYQSIGVSGHTLKHLAVAAGIGCMVAAARDLFRKGPTANNESFPPSTSPEALRSRA